MAEWTTTIGAPSTEQSDQLIWSAVSTDIDSEAIDPDLLDAGGTAYLGFLFLQDNGDANLRTSVDQNDSGSFAGPEMVADWETFASAIIYRAGSLELVLPGPHHTSNQSTDLTEPYSWQASAAKATEISQFITAFASLTDAQKDATTVTLRDEIPNTPPTITDPGDKTYEQGETITAFDITVTDPDAADTVTVSLSGLPSGLSYNATSGQVEGTVDSGATVQDYTVTITANDGVNADVTQDFTITITAPADLMPSFGSETVADQTYTQGTAITALQLPAATGGDAPLTYSISGQPSGFLSMHRGSL